MSETDAPRCDLVDVTEGPMERVELWRTGDNRYLVRVERLPKTSEPEDQHFPCRLRRREVELLARYGAGELDDVQPALDLLWAMMRTLVIGSLLLVKMGGESRRAEDVS